MENQGDVSPTEREALAKEFRDLEEIRTREAKSRAVVLEILGDIPDADITPPKNVLFVCKLNPVTEENDLKIIFSRFGTVKKCDIIKDYVTGDSLQYAFVEFETEESCNEAYFKMQNVLIDDRRIHVDFCQSVSGFWKKYYFKESFTRKKQNKMDNRNTHYKHKSYHKDKYLDRNYRDRSRERKHRSKERRRSRDIDREHRSKERERSKYREHRIHRDRPREKDRRHERRHRRSRSRSYNGRHTKEQYLRSRSSSSDRYRRRHS